MTERGTIPDWDCLKSMGETMRNWVGKGEIVRTRTKCLPEVGAGSMVPSIVKVALP